MRLSSSEITAIRDTIRTLDPDARIYLFGSRADDAKRGGDIDLLIFSDRLQPDDRGRIRWSLWELIGEQKIDIIVARDDTDPFIRIALKQGVAIT